MFLGTWKEICNLDPGTFEYKADVLTTKSIALILFQNIIPARRENTVSCFRSGHEGDPCLRTSDCSEGYCCARHFWTKICKPVLRLGEVCSKQRKKGSHSLEIFQRCDCAKGLSCKVWKDATSSSKSRLHMCQKI